MKIVRPSVPIIFKKFPYCPGYVKTEDDRKCKFFYLKDIDLQLYVPQDEALLINIEDNNYRNYKISLYRHKDGFKNINNFTNDNSILIDEVKVYDPLISPLVFALGLEYDTQCTINADGDNESFSGISGAETEQIEKIMEYIKQHGNIPYTSIKNDLKGTGNFIKCPEMDDVTLYAPITYKQGTTINLLDLYQPYNNNENIVYYSLVTDNLNNLTTYRPFKKTFAVHYMNYKKAVNYEMRPVNSNEMYYFDNESGEWKFNEIQIIKTANSLNEKEEEGIGCPDGFRQYPNVESNYDNRDNIDNVGGITEKEPINTDYVEDDDIIKEGIIEVYFNGEQYQFVEFSEEYIGPSEISNDTTIRMRIEELSIPKKTDNDEIKFRYIFKDGYHFITN